MTKAKKTSPARSVAKMAKNSRANSNKRMLLDKKTQEKFFNGQRMKSMKECQFN